ncbi:hypothetical protein BN1708_017608, partial [Verticillium longisporum]
YKAIAASGVKLETHSFGDYVFAPEAAYPSVTAAAEAVTDWDYIFVTTKALPDRSDDAAMIAPLVGPASCIVLIQNGVGVEAPFRARFPDTPVVSGVTVVSAEQTSPGVIRQNRWTRISIGPYADGLGTGDAQVAARGAAAVEALRRWWGPDWGGIRDVDVQDEVGLQTVRWHKLCINAAFNPSAVLSGGRGNADMILGPVEESSEPLAMLEYLRMRHMSSVVTTQDIREDFPDLHYKPGFVTIAGLLYVPLSVGGTDFIVFFRRGQVKEVKWAGNPYEKILREGTEAYLEPRKSFKTWHETVVGKCRDWTEEQVETAAVLCLVYGKFIEVWRQKEAALQSSKLTKLLLANSAHEVRTPLNAIINYLEIALEGSLDQETRDNLAKSHSASK